MSSRINLFLALLFIFWAFGCSSSNSYPDDFKGDQIHFGQGGGFAGDLSYFVLLEDGRLYQRGFRDSTFSYMDTWSPDFTAQIFSNYKYLCLDTVDHFEPGNLYYFIQYQARDKPIHRIAWGNPGFSPAGNTVTYYNLLYKSTKSKS